jgi:hypothetical protein
MISFYDMWLRIDELSSMSQVDSSGVELEKSEEGYEYKFDDFVVSLDHWHGKKVGGKMVDGIWSVDFTRGKSYALTGTSGSGGTAVYGKILGAVKKLTEVEDVNGLKFIGADPRQDIMYDKFLKTLGGFTHVGNDIYMRDEVIKANASGEDLEYYKGVSEKRENGIYNMKVAKVASRNKGLIGKITGYSDSDSGMILPAIILRIDVSIYVKTIVWDGARAEIVTVPSYDLGNFVSPSMIDQSIMSSLMVEIQKDDSSLSEKLKTSGLSVDGSTYDFGFKKETA